jgi:hypothetical protein
LLRYGKRCAELGRWPMWTMSPRQIQRRLITVTHVTTPVEKHRWQLSRRVCPRIALSVAVSVLATGSAALVDPRIWGEALFIVTSSPKEQPARLRL